MQPETAVFLSTPTFSPLFSISLPPYLFSCLPSHPLLALLSSLPPLLHSAYTISLFLFYLNPLFPLLPAPPFHCTSILFPPYSSSLNSSFLRSIPLLPSSLDLLPSSLTPPPSPVCSTAGSTPHLSPQTHWGSLQSQCTIWNETHPRWQSTMEH